MKGFDTEEWYQQYRAKRLAAKGAQRAENVETTTISDTPKAVAASKPKYHDYKDDFLKQIQRIGLPMPTHGQGCECKELQFARPRLWRFDWAYEDRLIAIEYQGGNYTGKGHNTIKNLRNDYEKFTEAAIRGWMLILIDSETVRRGQAATWVERALRARMSQNS